MEIKIETYNADEYEEIQSIYGDALSKFGLYKKNNDAYINISLVEDLIELNAKLKKLALKADRNVPDFGLIIHSDENSTPVLDIKDDYF